jgi:nitroreductase
MLLMANALGIGSCWLFWGGGNEGHGAFINRFNLSNWLVPIGMVCFGYPDVRPGVLPERKHLVKAVHYAPVQDSE